MPLCPITDELLRCTLADMESAREPYTHWNEDERTQLEDLYENKIDAWVDSTVLQVRAVYLSSLVFAQLQFLSSRIEGLNVLYENASAEQGIKDDRIVTFLQRASDDLVLLLTRFQLGDDRQKKAFQAKQGLAIASAREVPAKLDAAIEVFRKARLVLLAQHPMDKEFGDVGAAAAIFFHQLQVPYATRRTYAEQLVHITKEPTFPWRNVTMKWWTSLEGYAGS